MKNIKFEGILAFVEKTVKKVCQSHDSKEVYTEKKLIFVTIRTFPVK